MEDEGGVFGAVGEVPDCVEEARTATLDGFAELYGENGVGVDVGTREGRCDA